MRDALTTLIIRMGGAVLAFALQALLARTMTESDFGFYAVVWAWILSLGSFASLGLAEVALRLLPRYAQRTRLAALRGFFDHGFRATALAATLFSLLGATVAMALPLDATTRSLALAVCLGLPALALEFFLEGVARAMGWFRLTTLTIYVLRPLLLVLTVAGLWAADVKVTGFGVSALMAAAIGLTTIGIWMVMRHRLRHSLKGQKPGVAMRRFWHKQSLPLLVASGLDDLLSYLDVVVLGLLLSPVQSAAYFVAARVLTLANLVQHAFTFVAARAFSVALSDEGAGAARRQVWQATGLTVGTTTLAALATLAAAPLLLRLFGAAYVDGFVLVAVLAVAQVMRAGATQAFEYFLVLGRARMLVLVNLVAVAALVLLLCLLVPWQGALGASVAYATTMALRTVLLLALLFERAPTKRPQTDLRPRNHTV